MLQALGLVGLVTLLLRARERALRRRAEELEALVAERTRQLQDANAQLSELSVTDPLTGLANRRALEAHAEGEWRRIARAGGNLAFVMVDVDHFKAYNDSLGHMEGDDCLRLIATALRRLAQRPGDLVARYGGEEFACLFVGLEREQTRALRREAARHDRGARPDAPGLGRGAGRHDQPGRRLGPPGAERRLARRPRGRRRRALPREGGRPQPRRAGGYFVIPTCFSIQATSKARSRSAS